MVVNLTPHPVNLKIGSFLDEYLNTCLKQIDFLAP